VLERYAVDLVADVQWFPSDQYDERDFGFELKAQVRMLVFTLAETCPDRGTLGMPDGSSWERLRKARLDWQHDLQRLVYSARFTNFHVNKTMTYNNNADAGFKHSARIAVTVWVGANDEEQAVKVVEDAVEQQVSGACCGAKAVVI